MPRLHIVFRDRLPLGVQEVETVSSDFPLVLLQQLCLLLHLKTRALLGFRHACTTRYQRFGGVL